MTTATAIIADLATKTPVEIDSVLAPLWARNNELRHYIARVRADLAKKDQPFYWRREDAEKSLRDYSAKLVKVRVESKPFEDEYARRPWRRYFLVTNAGGHVHRGTSCSTCFPTTDYRWIVDLAGCDEGKMVEEYGEKACTVCFPDAPTNPAFRGPGRRDAGAKAARAAERSTRAAEKAAKAITAPDGSPLVVRRYGYGDRIATKVAAKNKLMELVRDLDDTTVYRATKIGVDDEHAEQLRKLMIETQSGIDQVSAALAAAGIDPAPIAERATKKAKKEMSR